MLALSRYSTAVMFADFLLVNVRYDIFVCVKQKPAGRVASLMVHCGLESYYRGKRYNEKEQILKTGEWRTSCPSAKSSYEGRRQSEV